MTSAMDDMQVPSVGVGEIRLSPPGGRLSILAGSCIGLFIHHPDLRVVAAAHILLPKSNESQRLPYASSPGRCADTAVETLMILLQNLMQSQRMENEATQRSEASHAEGTPQRFPDSGAHDGSEHSGVQPLAADSVVAYCIGGADMFESDVDVTIGTRNQAAVLEQLRRHGVSLAMHDLGGRQARRGIFNSDDGDLRIRFYDHPPATATAESK